MKHKSWLMFFLPIIFSLSLIACQPAAEPDENATQPTASNGEPDENATQPTASNGEPDENATTNEYTDFNAETPLCAIFPTLDGQRYNARGATNGDALATDLDLSHGEVVFDTIVYEMGTPNQTTPETIMPFLPQDTVVILVVDNFQKPSGEVVVLDGDVFDYPHSYEDDSGQTISVALKYDNSESVLTKMALYNDPAILIVGVDIGGFKIDQVSKNIELALRKFTSHPATRKFVINMSFALVPCNDLLQETFVDYQNKVNEDFDDLHTILEDLLVATYSSPDYVLNLNKDNSFFNFMSCLSGSKPIERQPCENVSFPMETNIILVGAAGNSPSPSYPFAFAPALWDEVVSASASNPDGNIAGYSNTGEVMMDGTISYGDVDVIGTSFASPRLALQQAIYLLSITSPDQGLVCTGSENVTTKPPLGYIPEAGEWNDTSLAKNLPLPTAVPAYCPAFPIP